MYIGHDKDLIYYMCIIFYVIYNVCTK